MILNADEHFSDGVILSKSSHSRRSSFSDGMKPLLVTKSSERNRILVLAVYQMSQWLWRRSKRYRRRGRAHEQSGISGRWGVGLLWFIPCSTLSGAVHWVITLSLCLLSFFVVFSQLCVTKISVFQQWYGIFTLSRIQVVYSVWRIKPANFASVLTKVSELHYNLLIVTDLHALFLLPVLFFWLSLCFWEKKSPTPNGRKSRANRDLLTER